MSIPVAPLGRASKRVHSGLMPEFFDDVNRVDVDLGSSTLPVIEEYWYTVVDPVSGNKIVTAIIEITYDNNTRSQVLRARRIDNTVP